MEVLTSHNRMSATMFLSLYFSENVITRLLYNHNSLAATQHSKDFLITYCLTLTFIMFCAFPLFTQIPPLLDEFITEVREQLTVFPSAEWTPPIQKIQQECCESQVFEAKHFFLCTPLQIHRMYICTTSCL